MFLTLEDPRAKIQGSRDPLGLQPAWVAFGRHVVTNLTTVTTVIRGFTTLLLGRYFGEVLVESGRSTEEQALSVFLRVEQVAAFASHVVHGVEDEVRGTQRVRKFISDAKTDVVIADDPAHWILSDQKTYGLWGLYTVSARVSGLLAEGPVGLTPRAREFVERHYVPRFRFARDKLTRLAVEGGKLSVRKSDPVLTAVASVLGELSTHEREFYGATLRNAEFTPQTRRAARQAILADLLLKHADMKEPTGRDEVLTLARVAEPRDAELSQHLHRIVALEAFFAPAEALFEYMQVRHSQKVITVAKEVSAHWGGRVPHLDLDTWDDLRVEVESLVGPEQTVAMSQCYAAMVCGEYDRAIESLLDWNRIVMAQRRASPWIRPSDGKLDVRYRAAEQPLATRDELESLWRNGYFINALKSIVRQLAKEGAVE